MSKFTHTQTEVPGASQNCAAKEQPGHLPSLGCSGAGCAVWLIAHCRSLVCYVHICASSTIKGG